MRNSLYNPFMPSLSVKDLMVYNMSSEGVDPRFQPKLPFAEFKEEEEDVQKSSQDEGTSSPTGFRSGGMPKAPGVAPTPVQDPGEFTEEDPGRWVHSQNWIKRGRERGEIKNRKTGAKKYTAYFKKGDKNSVAKAARELMGPLNKAYTEYTKNKAEYKKQSNSFKAYQKAQKSYDAKASAYQQANVKGQQELVQSALTDPGSLAKKAKVDTISAKTKGTTIAAGVGDAAGKTPQMGVTTAGTAAQAGGVGKVKAETVSADKVADDTKKLIGATGATGKVSGKAQIKAAQGELSKDAMADAATMDPQYVQEVTAGKRQVSSKELASAQGLDEKAVKSQIAQANVPDNIKAAQTSVQPEEIPEPAQIAESEMAAAEAMTMDGLSDDAVAVAAKLESFNVDDGTLAEFKEGKIEAQDTVQGQLANLMKQFDDGTPAWAAGAMRAANSAMAARGLGSSSMAGAAVLQAAMESALPIASKDADAFRSMKIDNLNRQQQISLANAAAQQGVELANFNAEQQTALQNSQNAFSLQSQNLSNMQQTVLANAQIKASLQGQNLSNQQQANIAEAARYAEVNNLNLNNRQQAILQDNANEMQVNLANMNSKQQAYLANAQLEAALQGKKIDNKQQTAMANAARYADAANLTFTAGEQAKIHNSELMKTVGLAELSSEQAATLQNAAAVASMDMANLSNEQQAKVQNAKAFLDMDMANLNNRQQAIMFKRQAMQQSLLSDQAAENAERQFNASSKNQTKQFMATTKAQINQFNVSQNNAMKQFNAGEKNAAAKFNAEIKNQRAQFNASNRLVVAQANAQWRQNVATLNSAAKNEANRQHVMTANAMTQSTMDQIWQRERDVMSMAWKSHESNKDRANAIILAQMSAEAQKAALKAQERAANSRSIGNFFGGLIFGG